MHRSSTKKCGSHKDQEMSHTLLFSHEHDGRSARSTRTTALWRWPRHPTTDSCMQGAGEGSQSCHSRIPPRDHRRKTRQQLSETKDKDNSAPRDTGENDGPVGMHQIRRDMHAPDPTQNLKYKRGAMVHKVLAEKTTDFQLSSNSGFPCGSFQRCRKEEENLSI